MTSIKRLSFLGFGLLFATAALAQLAVTGSGKRPGGAPVSTAISCPIAGSFTAPVSAGTFICTFAVTPSGWNGVLSLSGANAASFTLSGANLLVGGSSLAAGSYSVTGTSTP